MTLSKINYKIFLKTLQKQTKICYTKYVKIKEKVGKNIEN